MALQVVLWLCWAAFTSNKNQLDGLKPLSSCGTSRSFAGEGLERERFAAHVHGSYRSGLGFANAKANLESLNRCVVIVYCAAVARHISTKVFNHLPMCQRQSPGSLSGLVWSAAGAIFGPLHLQMSRVKTCVLWARPAVVTAFGKCLSMMIHWQEAAGRLNQPVWEGSLMFPTECENCIGRHKQVLRAVRYLAWAGQT